MSKILVIGTGPLFGPEVKLFNGQALRTWHFTKPLRDAGHAVDLVVLPAEGAPIEPSETVVSAARRDTFRYSLVNSTDYPAVLKVLQEIHDRTQYNCIVAVNLNAAIPACRLATTLPIWVDLNGHTMGEAQAKCHTYSNDEYLRFLWARQRTVLRRGDRFSAVSFKQMYAVLGELGALGRLNRHTFAHHFLSVVPNAAYEDFLNPKMYSSTKEYRGTVFPEDSFAILWSGGFNTWTDVRSLAAALSLVMEQDPRVRFVATGGAIPGHDDVTYNTFVTEMEKTGFKDRCHMLGWVEAKQLFPLYRECDLGINVDSLNYETMFGARNRLTNMMAAGLPVLTTLGTEISEVISENRLGYTCKIGNVQHLADAMLRAARNPSERKEFAARAKNFTRENFTYDATTRALLKWAAEPSCSPDNLEKIRLRPDEKHLSKVALNTLEEETLLNEENDTLELVKARAELDSIRGKTLFKVYKKLFR